MKSETLLFIPQNPKDKQCVEGKKENVVTKVQCWKGGNAGAMVQEIQD